MLGERVKGRAKKVALSVECHRRRPRPVRRRAQARHASASRQGDAGARRGAALAVRAAGDEGDARSSRNPIFRRCGSTRNVADRILFDARAPREATRPGGLGKAFDWRLLENLDIDVPFMLSGGLDAENVGEAIAITRAPSVDVSSGVEQRARREGSRQDPRVHPRGARGGGKLDAKAVRSA